MLHDLKGFLVVERFRSGNVYSISNEEIKDTILNKANTYLRINARKAIDMYEIVINEYKMDINNNLKNISIAYGSKARAYRRIDNFKKAIESII